ncbi:hypothetical protein NKH77_28120 [Streptomyces sp. M19]
MTGGGHVPHRTRAGRGPGRDPDRVAALLPEADPVLLPPAAVPVAVVHGTGDTDVPVELSRRYLAARAADRPRPTLLELDGVDHFAPVTPGHRPARRCWRPSAREAGVPVTLRA